jgi:hypothetical protein
MNDEMIFDTCQRIGGYVLCGVVRDLITERWQTIFADPSVFQHFVLTT